MGFLSNKDKFKDAKDTIFHSEFEEIIDKAEEMVERLKEPLPKIEKTNEDEEGK